MIHGRACADEPCPHCESIAEDRSFDWGFADDWQLAQTQYERHLDRMGGEVA